MKTSKIFWGSLIFTIGVLLLLYNIDYFSLSPGRLLKYWPILIIVWGITFFKLPKFIKATLSFLSGLFLGFLLVSLLNINISDSIEYRIKKSFGDKSVILNSQLDSSNTNFYEIGYNSNFQTAEFKLDAASGVFNFTELSDKLLEIETNQKNAELKSDIIDSTKIYMKFDIDEFYESDINTSAAYRVKLHPNPIWNINLDIGSPRLDMDLSAFKVRNLLIDGGAADIYLKLGDFYDETFVDMDLGISNIHILVPEGSGVTINSSAGISSNDFQNFTNLEEVSENKYQTDNWDNSEKKINIKIDSGISKIKIEAYK